MSLLQVESACVSYRRGGQRVEAVREVSFAVERGARLGIVGESGCGKSSLLRACLGLEPLHAGRITFDGQPVVGAGKALRRRFQPVFQDSASALDPRWSIAACLREPLELHGLPRDDGVIAALLEGVQLSASLAPRTPRELSAGQRQRVCLARALALAPELLLLDEPVSALDVSVQAQLLELLDRLSTERHIALVLVSHDLEVVAHLCTEILVMAEGAVVERGPGVLQQPTHPVTLRLLGRGG
jgi:ABC-type dipeptide/oligopeptide/nickel transport system ATPase subunit